VKQYCRVRSQKLIKELRPEVSTRAIAKALKTPETTMRRIGAAEAKNTKENKDAVRQSGAKALSGARFAKVGARAERVKDQQKTAQERIAKVALGGSARCRKTVEASRRKYYQRKPGDGVSDRAGQTEGIEKRKTKMPPAAGRRQHATLPRDGPMPK
jgi:hypothetical protein